ncbi:hypothetical protein [Providencia sp. PROV230]|uniref:hypothetical protein n=1 Tax=Providencia sp. PROV230 TaxID=2949922 RepID=UPI00234BC236|nr:hypothetical protein [Providencia sp. PROV230]
MSSHQNLAAPESNERRVKTLLTHEQKADLLHYIAPLTRLSMAIKKGQRVLRMGAWY